MLFDLISQPFIYILIVWGIHHIKSRVLLKYNHVKQNTKNVITLAEQIKIYRATLLTMYHKQSDESVLKRNFVFYMQLAPCPNKLSETPEIRRTKNILGL